MPDPDFSTTHPSVAEFDQLLASYHVAHKNYVTAPDDTADADYGDAYSDALRHVLEAAPPTAMAFVRKYLATYRDELFWDFRDDGRRLVSQQDDTTFAQAMAAHKAITAEWDALIDRGDESMDA